MDEKVKTKIHWDIGTAYDLFISLRILHEPERYSVRASWAAGCVHAYQSSTVPPWRRQRKLFQFR